jgi:hypothetical protein
MKTLRRLWSGLEAVSGLAAVAVEWQEAWGCEWEVGRAFLRLTDRSAASYPCPRPGGEGCPRKVVIHGQDDIVAVCQAVPRQCDDLILSKADIAIYELHWQKLAAAVGKALGLSAPRRPVPVGPHTVRVGWCSAAGGKRAAVYLTIEHEAQAFGTTLARLTSSVGRPFALAAPTLTLCESDAGELLQRAGAIILPLDECLAWEDSGEFARTDRAERLLSDLKAASERPTDSRSGRPQPRLVEAPLGWRWEELHLVVNDHRLWYVIRDKHGSIGFAEAGFEDRRKGGLPNDSWRLLGDFARSCGRPLPEANDRESRQRQKQRISKLRSLLRGLFQISGSPISSIAPGTYAPAFRIRPKDGITLTMPVGRTWSAMAIAETPGGRIRFGAEIPRRYLTLSDGRTTEFTQVAERLVPVSEEHELWELDLLEDGGEPNAAGRALLEVLRARGRVRRAEYDAGILRLSDLLHRITGIEAPAFRFVPSREEWVAEFEATSEQAAR